MEEDDDYTTCDASDDTTCDASDETTCDASEDTTCDVGKVSFTMTQKIHGVFASLLKIFLFHGIFSGVRLGSE